MVVKEVIAQNILIKSNLSSSDYVINPYIGCIQGKYWDKKLRVKL